MKTPLTGAPWIALGLTLVCANAPAHAQDAKSELQAIEKELRQEDTLLREAMKEASPEASGEIYAEFLAGVLPEFGERLAAVARGNKGSDLALEAWRAVIDLASRGMKGPLPVEALRAVASDHLESDKLAPLVQSLPYTVPAIEEREVVVVLKAIAKGSPHRETQAAAIYGVANVLGENRPVGDARLEEAKTELRKLAAFGDVKQRGERSYAEAAAAFLFALDNLAVGMPCPDFSALDAEGAAFKLSDYKGKVVLVDFWGFW